MRGGVRNAKTPGCERLRLRPSNWESIGANTEPLLSTVCAYELDGQFVHVGNGWLMVLFPT